ncbi:MAG: hypothetical protein HRO68_03135 [Nitrosopumilus sp.]|nr:hypothetical protein [Nitrosopumilus sp.]
MKRDGEIKQNFKSPSDSEHIIMPILDRISKIKSERFTLEQELASKLISIVMLMIE